MRCAESTYTHIFIIVNYNNYKVGMYNVQKNHNIYYGDFIFKYSTVILQNITCYDIILSYVYII